MQTFTKAQVLTLFLSSASATQTILGVLNGPSATATIPDSQTATTVNSGGACSSNADCADSEERCGAFQRYEVTTENLCVSVNWCGALGRINNVPFSVECWKTPSDGTTPVEPATVDPAAYLTAIEDLITEVNDNWDGLENILVSPASQYQDGWYILNSDSKWVEFDKPEDTRCFANRTCEENECCMLWPDSNNARCKATSMDGVLQNIGPTSFTPTCKADIDTSVTPESAQADLAAGALAEASEALGTFYTGLLNERKDDAKYAEMTDDEKAKFDEGEAELLAKREALWAELKTTAGYASAECDDDCKAVFEADLLAWGKVVYEECSQDKSGIACREAEKIKKDEETARATGDKNYYSGMTAAERTSFDTARVETVARLESSLAAAWIDNNKPAAGAEGSACDADNKCTKDTMCCGDSKPNAGNTGSELKTICVTSTDKETGTFTDGLGRGYSHTCAKGAQMLTAGAAFAAAAFALM